MTTLQNGDSFLVQRTDSQSGISTNYQVSQENLMANLADDDLLLVQRTSAGISTNYSITGSALKEDLGGPDGLIVPPVEVLTPINGAGITVFDQYEPLSSAITAVGEAGTIAKDTDEILSVADEAPIVSWDIADGSSPSFVNTDINFATELAAKGVTAITGINLYLDDVSGYPYTSNLGGFTLNNVDLVGAAQVSLISYNGTPYNSNYSWVSFFNGGGYNQCQGSTTYTCLFHPRSLGTVAKLKVLSVGGRVSLLDQDGAEHFIIGSSGKKVLSFPTNTNFSGLSVGDVVQGNPLNGTASVTQGYTFTDGRGDLDNLFNGVVTGNGTASSDYLNHLVQPNDAGGLPCTFTFDPPLSARSGTLKAYVTRYSAGNVNYTINGSVGHSVYAASSPVEDDTGVTSISTFTFDSNTGNAQLWGFADGEGVLQHVDNVTVTTIDAAATPPTITVNGGTWDDSNQSQVWSAGITTPSNTFNGGQPATDAFDGDLDTFVGAGSIGEDIVFQPTASVSYSNSVEVYISGHAGQIILNSNSPVATTDSPGWVTLVSGSSGSISSITIDPNSNRRATITSIRVDGKLLVDTGIRDLGDRKISSSIPYETSLTFTDTTELANMVAPLEMADATGGNSLTPTTSNVVSTSFTPSASYFNATTYTGNASVNVQTFNTGLDMQNNGGMIWFKSRTSGQAARIIDTYRGTRPSLLPHSTTLNSALGADGLTFLDDGFSIGWEGNDIASANDYVAWSFSEAAGFFDIVTWTGNGSSTREISHNLGSRPGFIIVKKTAGGANRDWWCWHKSISTGDLSSNALLRLNSTNGITDPPDNSPLIGTASSTMFEIAGDDNVNGSGNTYIAYIFADNPSKQIKCGSYAGTGPGMTVDVGFRPHWVMLKSSSNSSTNWVIADSSRPNEVLWPNSSDAAYPHSVSFTDTGFTLDSNSSYMNTSGYDYIYIAIGEAGNPDTTELTFQDNTDLSALTSGMTITSNLTPTLDSTFSVDTYTGNGDVQSISNQIDLAGEGGLVWIKNRNEYSNNTLYDTERGATHWLNTDHNGAPGDPNGIFITYNSDGFSVGNNATLNYSGYDMVSWTFRKAPGFFDIQTYTGNGDGNGIANLPHQLGSEPGMIIIKRTSAAGSWYVYHKGITRVNGSDNPAINNFLLLDSNTNAQSYTGGSWASTATTFTAPFGINSNFANHEYLVYLFADNPSNGIKCGSYTGTGADDNNIECGFEPTWIMVKNVDESGSSNNNKSDWYISDNQRGFTSSWGQHGKSLSANKADSELSDPNFVVSATGFKPATSGAEYNKFGVKYIYMAIGSPTHLTSIPTGTLLADADPSNNTAIVDATSWPTGDSVTGPSLSASLTSILEVSGNTIFGNGPTGTWLPGYYAEGSQVNDAPPGPSEITFTSQNQGTPGFSGVDATLASRTWTLESGAAATGPWTVVDTYVDYDVLNSQDGATPWTSNKPTLQSNTYYRIKVQYNSTNAESVESVYHTFKTGDA